MRYANSFQNIENNKIFLESLWVINHFTNSVFLSNVCLFNIHSQRKNMFLKATNNKYLIKRSVYYSKQNFDRLLAHFFDGGNDVLVLYVYVEEEHKQKTSLKLFSNT